MSLVYFAKVLDTKDPLGLGRVQVSLKGFLAAVDMTDVWLRMVTPYASKEFGFVFLPEVGDEVAVLRAAGDTVDSLLILGAVYNGANKPLNGAQEGKNETKEIRTKTGNAITFSDKAGEEGIVVTTADKKITITISNKDKGTVTVTGADAVTVESTTSLTIKSKDVKIEASGTLDLGGATEVKVGSGDFTVSGKKVSVTGSGDVAITGTSVAIG